MFRFWGPSLQSISAKGIDALFCSNLSHEFFRISNFQDRSMALRYRFTVFYYGHGLAAKSEDLF